jgi:VanZ family protein
MSGGVLYAAMRFVRTWLPVILWSLVILSASNDNFSSGATENWVSRLFGQALAFEINVAIRKLGHLVAYGILGFLAWRADRRTKIVLGIVLLVAVIDETRQAMMLSRRGTPWDVLLDLGGAWIAITIANRLWRVKQPV